MGFDALDREDLIQAQYRAGLPAPEVSQATAEGSFVLNTLAALAQYFSNDTNVQISSTGDTHTIVWVGTLASARGGLGFNGSAAGNGTLPIGNGAGFTLAALTAGSGIQITNGAGTITIAVTGKANSGANSDITSLTGLTGALQAASGSAINFGRAAISMPGDADYTVGNSEFNKLALDVASGVALTATRSLVVPTTDGTLWIVKNSTTGAQSITVKTAAGTGVTIANGMSAMVRGNGVNIVRVTADA